MTTTNKTQVEYLQAHSLRDLLHQLNKYNTTHTNSPILKDDIVDIYKEEGTFILLYYK